MKKNTFIGKVRNFVKENPIAIWFYFEDMNQSQRVKHVFLLIAKFVGLLTLLYIFVCSLDIMSSAFRLVGGRIHAYLFVH